MESLGKNGTISNNLIFWHPSTPVHIYAWKEKETGSGQMKIIKVEANKEVDIELLFKEPFESLADTKFDIAPEGNGNKVTWTMNGKNNIISKWICLVIGGMDKMIGKILKLD